MFLSCFLRVVKLLWFLSEAGRSFQSLGGKLVIVGGFTSTHQFSFKIGFYDDILTWQSWTSRGVEFINIIHILEVIAMKSCVIRGSPFDRIFRRASLIRWSSFSTTGADNSAYWSNTGEVTAIDRISDTTIENLLLSLIPYRQIYLKTTQPDAYHCLLVGILSASSLSAYLLCQTTGKS